MEQVRESAKIPSAAKTIIVAALDFGTTYSGYAFSLKTSPLDIKTNQAWFSGVANLVSLKTPSVVLLTPEKEFHSFGYQAEAKYTTLCEEDSHHGWYLFKRFKMLLYKEKKLGLNTTIEDVGGKTLSAITIFSHAIKFLKDHLFQTVSLQMPELEDSDISYVITVPAIWSERAKLFMGKAALKAGIRSKQLKMALEPEAASIWCQIFTDESVLRLTKPGTKYMVVDLGGGTADITVHEKLADGSLKELQQATGGAWGGNQVDIAFLEMLTSLVGDAVIQDFKTKYIEDYVDLLASLEMKKRSIKYEDDSKIVLRISSTFEECCRARAVDFKKKIEASKWNGSVALKRDKLHITHGIVMQFFNRPLDAVINHVKELFQASTLHDVDLILLVGGFAESDVVQKTFKASFSNKIVLIPPDSGTVVLKGAVRFGHLPNLVTFRIARCSFGREAWPEFKTGEHEEKRKVLYCNKSVCKEVFWPLVKKGEEVPLGKEIKEVIPGKADWKGNHFKIYCSTDANTKYITDESCHFLGEIRVPLPGSPNPEDNTVQLSYIFGDTKLKVRVKVLKSGTVYETNIEM